MLLLFKIQRAARLLLSWARSRDHTARFSFPSSPLFPLISPVSATFSSMIISSCDPRISIRFLRGLDIKDNISCKIRAAQTSCVCMRYWNYRVVCDMKLMISLNEVKSYNAQWRAFLLRTFYRYSAKNNSF